MRGAMTAFRMPFGTYRGQPIEWVDLGYLHWLLDRPNLYAHTRDAVNAELTRRNSRRRSWKPVAKARWPGVLSISGRGPIALIQSCGGYRLWSISLYDTREEAEARRPHECGYDGPADCQPGRHFIIDLREPAAR